MNRYKARNNFYNKAFALWGAFCTGVGLFALAFLLFDILSKGIARLSPQFLSNLPSRFSERSGIKTALFGMGSLLLLTIAIALPLGICAGIYLQEYSKKNALTKFIEINITNLAAVPSIIYGILGLQIFVRMLNWGNSLLSGAFTLALLILPIIIVSTREAIKAVPNSLREASYGMGASKWQTVSRIVLPSAWGGILTGIILAISRAIGETAPLIVIGALLYVPFLPEGPLDQFTVLTMQIFNWTSRPEKGFIVNAAAGIIVLLLFTFVLNGVAVGLRMRWTKKNRMR